MKLLRRAVFSLVLVLAFVIVGASILAGISYKRGDRLLSVQTGSMVPAVRPGDAVYVRPATLEQLRVGDVISYRNPADRRIIVSHRLVEVDHISGRLVTKGDALEISDRAFPYMLVIGRVERTVPHLGAVLDWLHRPNGLMLAVYLPAAILIGYEVKRLVRHYNHKPTYRSAVPGRMHV